MSDPQQRVVRAMQRAPLFSGVGARHLFQLLEGAERIVLEVGERVFERGAEADAFYILTQGQLTAVGKDGRAARIEPTACFGARDMAADRPRRRTVTATLPSRMVRVGWQRMASVLRRSASFRRSLRPPERARARFEDALFARTAERVMLIAEGDLPGDRLTWLLARTLQADHGDSVAVMSVRPGARGVRRVARAPVPCYEISADPRVLDAQRFGDVARRFTYLFVDVSAAPAAARRAFLEGAHKVVNVFHHAPPPRRPGSEGSAWFDTVLLPAGGWGRPRPDLAPGTCRLRLDPERAARAADLADLHPDDRAAMGRWGRAVTDRTVGVALGGGGAWGFAHVAVLRALHGRIPIDVISGASFGAVAGAFYAVGGLDGLAHLVSCGRKMRHAVLTSMINSNVLQQFIRRELGPHNLEDLAPVLLPVATNVSTGDLEVLRGLSVAEAVRASSAFPGALTPTTRMGDGRRLRLVDGGIASNVPDSVLYSEGADFVVAANVVPPPPRRAPGRPLLPGAFGTWLHEFNPLSRTVDAYRSAFILMHTAGYNDASLADVVYDARPLDYFALDFHHAEGIVARAEVDIEGWADQAVRRWREALSQG